MIYDDLAARLAAEYRLFLFALAGRYQQMRAPGVEITPRAIADLSRDAHELGNTFYQLATREIDDYLQGQIVDRSDALQSALVVRSKEVKALVFRMVAENAQQVIAMARTGTQSYASLLKRAAGAMGLLVQRQFSKTEFKVTDMAGRKWVAEKLMRTVVRDFAYQSFIDRQLDEMAAAGVKLAMAFHREGENLIDCVIFSIAGDDPEHPSLDDIRRSVFHPNATAEVMPYVPA